MIRIFTLAPEMPGALECIRTVREKTNVEASIGHTNATYEEAKAGMEAGARHVTHLFNAQTPLAHRDPGVVGAALQNDDVTTEMICDNFHINPAVFPLVRKMKGDKLVLITDCTRAGGLEDGEYTLGGQPIFVKGRGMPSGRRHHRGQRVKAQPCGAQLSARDRLPDLGSRERGEPYARESHPCGRLQG